MEVNETNRPLTGFQANEAENPVSTVEQTTDNVKYEPKQSKEEVIQRLKEINENICEAEKQEIDFLKQTFYKLHKSEQEANRRAFIEQGGDENSFVPDAEPLEAELKSVLAEIKEKRNSMAEAIEKEKEDNLQKKMEILEKMRNLTESSEDAGKNYKEFKSLQQEWNEIKLIPANKINETWRTYQLYTEKFYDMLKLNIEFREYDFKKNMEQKIRLCEAAEKLADEADVISAFRQLQKLHQEFREIGPVAKEMRESVWARFKAASTVINKRHQKHFEELKEQEQTNLDQKTVICEIAEAMEYDKLTTFTDWDDKTKEILALQAKWKTIGFAPQKMNLKIFERFRAACDEFFRRKAEFFKAAKEKMTLNLEEKKRLCEKAEALKDSTAWKETAEVLINLQKEWKTIGPVPKKYSDSIWKRFIDACDYFFEQKSLVTSSQRSEELDNLNKKEELLKQLEELYKTETYDETVADKIRELTAEWNSIGFVPFKDKDRLYKEFRNLTDKIFDKANLSSAERKLNSYRSKLSKESNLYREREKLVRIYERIKNDIKTYENNLGFLNSSSKKGNSLVSDVSRKIERLKDDLTLTQRKIEAIEETINQ